MTDTKGAAMSSSNLVRLSGLAATLGGVLGIVLTPVLSYLWATYSDAYGYYGRAYFPVFLGCLAGLAGLYALRKGSAERSEEETWGFGLTFAGLVTGLIGDVLAYWGGAPGEDFTQLQARGFGIEVTGMLILLVGSVVLGVAALRSRSLPRVVALMLILAAPSGVFLSALVHMPSGTMLVYCCAWVVLGCMLLTRKGIPDGRPRSVSGHGR
jgi:hypothetical protein